MELRFENLTKAYGDNVALKDFNVVMTEGVYGILGPNGSGKSTLMNCITDNIKRTSGNIYFGEKDILDMGAEFRSYVGFMPQQQGFYDNFSAERFIMYIAGLKGLKRKEAKEQMDELLKVVGLYEVKKEKISGFSGGMKQRVLLVSALLGNPKIVIMDEPTAGLDPEERIRIRNFISKIAKNRIVILATHVVSDIECIADKVIMMKKGKLIGMDTPYELMKSVSDKIYEKVCTIEEAEKYQEKYKIGSIFQRPEGMVLRIVSEEEIEGFKKVSDNISLEDVYLYYLKGR